MAARLHSVTPDRLCQNGGYCKDTGNSHECRCLEGYYGSYCQNEVNECLANPCQNGATCKDLIGTYQCTCPKGYQGRNCEFNINDCDPNPCQHGGTCYDLVDEFRCSCPHGTLGILCEINVNECFDGACHHGGTCVDKVGGYECKCRPGYVGPRCEGDVNECLSSPCSPRGTQECIQLVNSYNCVCKSGFMGRHCETKRNFCQHSPCQNGGVCTNSDGGHACVCPAGYSGPNCEFLGSSCENKPCLYGGTCLDHGSDFKCLCPAGTTGKTCEQDTRNECTYNPCQNGRCIDRIGDFDCSCKPEWRGKNCEISDKASPGGIDLTNGQYKIINNQEELQKCIENRCNDKKGDNRCDEECNTHICDYDGGDCRLGFNPWKFCNVTTRGGKNCWDVFKDGTCDEACNRKECLFDGYDCETTRLPCNKHYDAYCSDHYGNGQCDDSCNNAACGWDGLDCEPPAETHKIIPGSIYVVLAVSKDQFNVEKQKRFVRYLSLVMRTNFRIKTDENGEGMVFEYSPEQVGNSDYAFNTNLVLQARLGIIVYMEIDNVKCSGDPTVDVDERCFSDVEGYANYFSAMMGKSEETSEDWGIVQVGYAKGDAPAQGADNNGIIIGLVVIALVVVALGVLVQTQKKRAKGVTWFPEGFFPATTQPLKRKNDGQEMFGFGNSRFPSSANMDGWSDDDPLEHPSKKRRAGDFSSGQTMVTDVEENDDGRQWTQHHLNAAGNVGMLTPPQAEMMVNDVDVRGPMGMTPLMIAATRGAALDSGDFENFDEEDSTTAVIQDLLAQGANIQAQMDKTGESPLHLAARFARADAAKKLLDAGADANAQDHSGRTPLHSAVSTDAQGVFHILLKNRATNLNAKTFDGTTPLILAARLAIEGMVEQLIDAEVDVNLADDQGKTALHWGASVNNVEAVNVLLAHGANRDAQDNKDETPLFLAAREGAYQAARALLDHCANRDIQDHMDRLPIHVAHERMHQDIVQLLEEHIPPAPPMNASLHSLSASNGHGLGGSSPQGPQMNNLMSNQQQSLMGTKQRPKKRAKATSPNGTQNIDESNNGPMNTGTLPKNSSAAAAAAAARKPSFKRKKADSDMMSPDNSPYNDYMNHHSQMQYNSGALGMSHPNFEDLLSGGKQPPSYEAAVNSQHNTVARSMQSLQGGMPGQQNLKAQYNGFMDGGQHSQQQQQQVMHPRQQSMPASVSSYSSHLSPPHSNMSHHLQSPPPQNNSMSPPNHGIMMSPTQSVQSNHTMSPPSHQMMSPPQHQQQQLSPAKSAAARSIQLPTSPTHMAALRGATHQKLQSFDFCNDPNLVAQYAAAQQQFLYPNPNQTNLNNGRNDGYLMDNGMNSFMTPSPDSPGQWSSGSPQSHSDWSEGIQSPPAAGMNQYHQQQHMNQQQQLLQPQQTDGVLI